MNSVNYIAAIGNTPQTAPKTRPPTDTSSDVTELPTGSGRAQKEETGSSESETSWTGNGTVTKDNEGVEEHESERDEHMIDEKTPLLSTTQSDDASGLQARGGLPLYTRIGSTLAGTFRFILSAVLAPGRYLIACFYDESGHFSAALPMYRVARTFTRRQKKTSAHAQRSLQSQDEKKSKQTREKSAKNAKTTTSSNVKSEADNGQAEDSPARHTRSKSSTSEDADSESSAPKRSIRIKVLDEESVRQRKQRRDPKSPESTGTSSSQNATLTVTNIKSPMSLGSNLGLTRYPRAPAPPRPLVPRRQPSYTTVSSSIPLINTHQKTLIIDLDETLIHSMAKGGRMSTGHMVEVKLQQPVGVGGQIIGPQVPILYYVHKRPHCDEFLRKVSKWYNLIIFTASVQEYADPVIDWLELERKYFSARYYRQHCTYRNGAYIKDLSQVEPDLSCVMILDNSPVSYIFHEDNAIPIEGWISDPTDNDLLHLIPLLEGLQHTTDVRALLALRLGEATAHSSDH